MQETCGSNQGSGRERVGPNSWEDKEFGAEEPGSADAQRLECLQVLRDVILRRARGEQLSDDEVIAAHPTLMPKIRSELIGLKRIHSTNVQLADDLAAAGFAGSTDKESKPTPILSDHHSAGEIVIPQIHRYRIRNEISSGGQATVYEGTQETTGRKVAIKILHGGGLAGSRGRKRFEREIRILAHIKHANVVSILDRGRTSDGSLYLVMDFIEGTKLDSFLGGLNKDVNAIARIFKRIARALQVVHDHGIIHRDLKPGNILVSREGEPCIIDFGMAKLTAEDAELDAEIESTYLTRTGQVLGSLPWSSPEQVNSSPKDVDGRSDVYSVGVMLFNALTDQFPYPVDGSTNAVFQHITRTIPSSVRTLAFKNGINANRNLEEVVLQALAKSPNERHETAGKLADDLELWLDGKRPIIRHKTYPLVRITIVILALIAVAYSFSLQYFKPKSAPPYFVNRELMKFVRISGGSVETGVVGSNGAARQSGGTLHLNHDFYMSSTDVTEQEFLRVVNAPPTTAVDLNCPVANITYSEAVAFCEALSKRDHRSYRLPTSDEWQYAFLSGGSAPAMAGDTARFGWNAVNSKGHIHPVAGKQPDRWGLFDTLGNVQQWCTELPSSNSSNQVRAPLHLGGGVSIEGTDYLSTEIDLKSHFPGETSVAPDTALPTVGFRVVCESYDTNQVVK